MTGQNILSIGILFLYLAILVYIGWRGYKGIEEKSLRDIFVAKGRIGNIIIFLTALASSYSAFTFLGCSGFVYQLGMTALPIIAAFAIMDMPLEITFGRKIWALAKKYKYVTPSDLYADRYHSNTVRALVAIICVVGAFFYISVQLVACGYVINMLSGEVIPYAAGITIIAILMGVYIVLGGMRAVAWTDALQAILLLVGLVAIGAFAWNYVGGNVFQQINEVKPDLLRITMSPVWVLTYTLGVGAAVVCWPHMTVRYYAGRRQRAGLNMGMGEGVGAILTCVFGAMVIGLAGVLVWPELTGKAVDRIPLLFVKEMPWYIIGPFMAAAIAAAMSTADSILLVLSSIFSRDLYQTFINPKASQERLTNVGRIVSVILIIGVLIFALRPPATLIDICLKFAWPGFCILLAPMLGALLWRRATREGAIASLVGGIITVILTTFLWPDFLNIWSGVWAIIISAVLLIIVSYLTPSSPKEIIARFHDFLEETKYSSLEETKS